MDFLGHFLNSASKTDLLTPEEEITLARQIQNWLSIEKVEQPTKEQRRIMRLGRAAYHRFFQANIKLVVYIAKKYTHKTDSMTIDDLIQEGCIGLSHGIRKFDPERGYKFSTYGYWWVKQSIHRAIEMTDKMIRLPVNAHHLMHRIRKYQTQYLAEHGRTPTARECAEHVNTSLEYLKYYMMHNGGTISLDAYIKRSEANSTYIDMVADESIGDSYEHLEEEDQLTALDQKLKRLRKMDREIVQRGYGLNGYEAQSIAQTAQSMNIGRNKVRFRRSEAIEKLRKMVG